MISAWFIPRIKTAEVIIPSEEFLHAVLMGCACAACILARTPRHRATLLESSSLYRCSVWLTGSLGSGAKAHMQHSNSPSSSIWQGGMRFMQPGHTPWWMA